MYSNNGHDDKLQLLYSQCNSVNNYAVALLCTALNSKYDYKIQYEDISKLFLLEKPDDRYTAFVISLEKPIRQGQQKYQHLVLQVRIHFILYKYTIKSFHVYL
jgi:hypothetical protein